MFITGDNNFRYQVDPQYKANRRGKVDPIYRGDANQYLVTDYGGLVTDGYEADDAMGIWASRYDPSERIVCSIDKDLKQIEGSHYNWRKNEFSEVSSLDGTRLLYRQLLTGDSADNVPGVGGIGPVKSARIINSLTEETDMFQAVKAFYKSEERMIQSGRLLYIMRNEGEDWYNKYKELNDQTKRSEEEDPSSVQE